LSFHQSDASSCPGCSKVLVIGGSNNIGFNPPEKRNDIEILDFSGENKLCSPIENYPLTLESSTAAFYNGRLLVCGGIDNVFAGLGTGPTKDCYQLLHGTASWEPIRSLTQPDFMMRSSVINDNWLISGGTNDPYETISFNDDDGVFIPGPYLLYEKVGHCQLTLNSTHVIFVSGKFRDTLMLNWNTKEWTLLENIPLPLEGSACGLLENKINDQGQLFARIFFQCLLSLKHFLICTNECSKTILSSLKCSLFLENYKVFLIHFFIEILVAKSNRAYIFSMTDLMWRDDPTLPIQKTQFASAFIDDAVFAIGGIGADGKSTTSVLRYDSPMNEWIAESNSLRFPRHYATAIPVPDDFLDCS